MHYVAMAGLYGCTPNFCESCDTLEDAVEALADLHELGQKRKAQLKWDRHIELDLRRDGNEYAKISECNCDDPAQHNDY